MSNKSVAWTMSSLPPKFTIDGRSTDVEASSSSKSPAKPTPKSVRFKFTVAFLVLTGIISSIDGVIVGACLSAIAEDLKLTSVESFWVGTSFLLSQSVAIPIYGTLSDIFGRKGLIISAHIIFFVASILCATAQNAEWLIAARTLKGIGAGGLANMMQVIMSDISTLGERATYAAYISIAYAVGSTSGIPIGGSVAENASWHWIFWINLPLCAICICGLSWSLQLPRDPSSLRSKLKRIDYVGIVVFSAATTYFLYGLTTGGTVNPWVSRAVLGPMIVGLCLYPVFVYIESCCVKNPMIPLRIFRDRTANTAFFGNFFHGAILWAYLYYMILFYLGSLRHGRLHSAMETLSATAFMTPAGIIAGALIRWTKHFRNIICIGWVFLGVGIWANTTMHPDSSLAVLYGPRCIAGIGGGILFTAPLIAVQVRQEPEDVGAATTMQVFWRSLGTAFGVAIGGVIFQNSWSTQLSSYVADGRIDSQYAIESHNAEVAYEIMGQFPKAVQSLYESMYADSLSYVWWFLTAAAALAFTVSLFARDESVNREES